jgi:hypothetical protein
VASTNTDTGPADGPHLPPAGRAGPGPIAHAARFAGAAAL